MGRLPVASSPALAGNDIDRADGNDLAHLVPPFGAVDVVGDRVYVADEDGGLVILRLVWESSP